MMTVYLLVLCMASAQGPDDACLTELVFADQTSCQQAIDYLAHKNPPPADVVRKCEAMKVFGS
jgi:hypothetical protein